MTPRRAAELLDGAGALLICAGAGMGVDSGLPDFRGGEGFWRAYPPYARLGLRFEEIADPRHFAEDPELAWGFYGHRLDLYRKTVPHGVRPPARDPAPCGSASSRPMWTDSSRRRASSTSPKHTARSTTCSVFPGAPPDIWPAGVDVQIETEPCARTAAAVVPAVAGLARPNILMFGDYEWVPDRSQEELES